MSSSRAQQESGHAGQSSNDLPQSTSSAHLADGAPISNRAETRRPDPPAGTPGNPLPDIRTSQEQLFSQEETEERDCPPAAANLPPATETEGESVGSRPQSHAPERAPESRAATPRAGDAREHTTIPGLPPSFPPPPSVMRSTPPGVHRGPASSSSMSNYRHQLNPQAQPFAPANLALAMLRRGPPPGTRDPRVAVLDLAAGEVVVTPAQAARYRANAARHAARVFQRLMDADSDIQANALDREFTRVFGQQYQDEVVRLIGDPPEDTVSNNSDSVD